MKNLKTYFMAHKIRGAVAIILAIYVVYYLYGRLTSTSGETLYTTATADKQTIVVSVTGSGQVSALNQFDIKPKVSGDVIYVGVTNGQDVSQGQLIAELDPTAAAKAVRDAETSLETAKLTLAKLLSPSDDLTLFQAKDAVTMAEQAKSRAVEDLAKSYDDSLTAISGAFIDLPSIVSGIQDLLYSYSINTSQDNISYYADLVKNYDANISIYKNNAVAAYQNARVAYDKNFLDYKTISRYSATGTIESLLNETANTARAISESVKSTDNFLSFVKDRLTERNLTPPSQLATHSATLGTFTSKINSSLSTLTGYISSIESSKTTLQNSDSAIYEKTAALTKLQTGADPLDIRADNISVQQHEDALTDANTNLSYYYIRAPFTGTIAKINIKKGDSAGSGAAIATLVTKQKMAVISLNEVDAAKIKTGEKVTLTFDAIDGLTIAGEVASVDTIGTVSQGVVTYNVQIGFDTDDSRIKTGMSVSAAIVTDVKTDVVSVQNSAIKSQGANQYVETFPQVMARGTDGQGTPSATPPTQVIVETGLSNDTLTEITSGLTSSENVVIRKVTATPATTAQAPSLLNAVSGSRSGNGNIRGIGR